MLTFTEHSSDNTTLVFLHYFGGSQHTWHHVVEALKPTHRCITVDLPGFGDSRNIPGYSVAEMAEQVRALLQSLAPSPVVLIGHSMGGKVSMLLAADPTENLQQVILVAPSPLQPEPMTEEQRATMTVANTSENTAKDFVNNGAASALRHEDERIGIEDVLRTHPDAWTAWPQSGTREDWSDRIHNVAVHTDLIMGELDQAIPLAFQQKYTLPLIQPGGGQFIVIAAAAHMLPYEAAPELAIAIERCLEH